MSYLNNNCSNFTNEEELLLLCVREQINKDHRIKLSNLLENDINWDYLLKLAAEHKIKPLVYSSLKTMDKNKIPEEVFIELESHFIRNLQKNLMYLGHLHNILKLFHNNKIKSIPYKGPVLALNAYGNLGLREFVDLDIFVQKKDIVCAKNTLVSNGYISYIKNSGFKENIYYQFHRDMLFFDSDRNVNIEIQWNFIGQSFTYNGNIFKNPKNIQSTKLNNKEIFSLSSEDMLLILCIHASGHLWEQISWICDIAVFINVNKINWASLIKKSKILGFNRILNINLLLSIELFDLKIPNEFLELISHDEYSKNLVSDIIKVLFQSENSERRNFYLFKMRYKIRENPADGFKDFIKIIVSNLI
jgi:hypothetical protein